MQEVKGITVLDAFKALDDVDDVVIQDEVEKITSKKKLKESLKEDRVETIDISGRDMYDKGQAYYYARTGDKVDFRGNKYTIVTDEKGGHKIGYSDTILLKGPNGKTIEVAKKDFIKDATLLKEEAIEESGDDYWVLSDGQNPKNSNVFSKIDDLDAIISKLEASKGKGHWELLHYINGTPKKVWDSEKGRVDESIDDVDSYINAFKNREGKYLDSNVLNMAIDDMKKAKTLSSAMEIAKAYTNLNFYRFKDNDEIVGSAGMHPSKTKSGRDSKKMVFTQGNRVYNSKIERDDDKIYFDKKLAQPFIDKALSEECNLKEEPTYGLEPEYDSRKSFYGKAKVEERPDGTKILYSYGTPVCKIKGDKATLLRKGYLGWASSQTTLRHVKEFLKQHGFEAGSINDLRNKYPVEQATYNEALTLTEGILVDILDKEEVEEGKKFIEEDDDEHIEQVVDVDANTVEELKDSYVGNVLLRCPVCKTPIFKKPELLEKQEDTEIYNVGETCPHCGSKDGFELCGQIATMEVQQPKPVPTTGKDEIESTSATLEDKVTDNEVSDEKPEEEPEEKPEENKEENKRPSVMAKESLELKGLSEDTFNTLVNKYLEATYNNVECFNTTACDLEDKNLIVEGVIKFKSGKEKPTKFVLENKVGKNPNKVRFVGMNETFSKSKRTFNLVCSNDKGNLMCESLSYGYKAKDKEVKGKVKI